MRITSRTRRDVPPEPIHPWQLDTSPLAGPDAPEMYTAIGRTIGLAIATLQRDLPLLRNAAGQLGALDELDWIEAQVYVKRLADALNAPTCRRCGRDLDGDRCHYCELPDGSLGRRAAAKLIGRTFTLGY